jgi:hypothetical protein
VRADDHCFMPVPYPVDMASLLQTLQRVMLSLLVCSLEISSRAGRCRRQGDGRFVVEN